MQRLLRVIMVISLIFITAVPVLCADLKIGYVDIIKVFNEYKKTNEYDKALQDKQSVKETERDKKVADIKKLQDQYALLSDAEKEKKKTEIEKKAQELDDFRRQAVTDLRKQQNDYMGEIGEEIDGVVKKIAQSGNYDFILNGQSVLFGKEAFDITNTVLEELNKNYKGKK